MKHHSLHKITLGMAAVVLALTAGCGAENGKPATASEPSSSGEEASAPAAQKTPVKIKIGLDTAATGSPQFRVAKEKGFLEQHGIDAEFSDFPYGIDTINAMLVNRTDAGSAADYALLNSLGKGDMVIAATLSRATEKSAARNVLVVREDIGSEQELVGRKLGVPRATAGEYLWAKYLEKLNIPQSDIKFVNYSSPDEAVVALQKGDMDAIWASGALRERLESVKGLKELTDANATGVYTKSFIIFQRSFAQGNPDAVAATLKALNEGTEYLASHHEETAEILFNSIKLPKEGVQRDLEASNYVISFAQEDFDHLKSMHQWLIEQGLLKDEYNLQDKLYLEPLKQALPDSVTYQP